MNLKKLRKSMGCLMLTGSMILAASQPAAAAAVSDLSAAKPAATDTVSSLAAPKPANTVSSLAASKPADTDTVSSLAAPKPADTDTVSSLAASKPAATDTVSSLASPKPADTITASGLSAAQQQETGESETTAVKESESERQTDGQTEPASESETEQQTEPTSVKPVDLERVTEPQSGSESETKDSESTEPQSSKQTESESEPQSGKQKNDKEDSSKRVVDMSGMPIEMTEIEKPVGENTQEDHSDANANLTTNIIAGNGIYLSELANTYYLTFEEGFSEVMDEIEADFRQWLDKPEDFLARNWQDVLAVYVLRTREETGKRQMTLGKASKKELERIFFLMNIRSDSTLTRKLSKEVDLEQEICSLTADDYAQMTNVSDEEKEILDKYTGSECRKLCSIITAAKGFVRGEVGEGVSEERISIVAAACSLVGKVGYFWGGKSYARGWDSLWGKPMTVTAGGSKSTGTSRGYGLDCSGFVCWSFYNGLNGTDGGIGNHTTTQWNASEMVDSHEAKPGDLVFYKGPEAGDQNHVGLVIGKNENGSLLVAHCSSSRNGVVVGEAWSSGFKYVRRPLHLK